MSHKLQSRMSAIHSENTALLQKTTNSAVRQLQAEDITGPVTFLRSVSEDCIKSTILELFGVKNPSLTFYIVETCKLMHILAWQLPTTTTLSAFVLYACAYMAKLPRPVNIVLASAFLVFAATKLGKGFLIDLFILLICGRFAPRVIKKCLELEQKESESPVVATKALAVR